MSDVMPEEDMALARAGAERVVATLNRHLGMMDDAPGQRAKLTDDELNEGRGTLLRTRQAADTVLRRLRRPGPPPAP